MSGEVNVLQTLISENDQNEAGMLDWLRQASALEMVGLMRILETSYKDPCVELMSMFARVAFYRGCEQVLRERKQKAEGKEDTHGTPQEG
jgi:hypothetical protein